MLRFLHSPTHGHIRTVSSTWLRHCHAQPQQFFFHSTPHTTAQKTSPPLQHHPGRKKDVNENGKISGRHGTPESQLEQHVEQHGREPTVFSVDEHNESLTLFYKLGLVGPLCRASVLDLDFEEPTEIQQRVIPHALKNRHIVASAETGTGKTAAYAFPIIQKLFMKRHSLHLTKQQNAKRPMRALILCPTRELAEQVHGNVVEYVNLVAKQQSHKWEHEEERNATDEKDKKEADGKDKEKFPFGLNVMLITGQGQSMEKQEKKLKAQQVDVVVATPGRLVELLRRRFWMRASNAVEDLDDMNMETAESNNSSEPSETIVCGNPLINMDQFVVDECDRMMSMGFLPDLREIFYYLPKPPSKKKKSRGTNDPTRREMQVMMFSATLLPQIEGLMKRFAPTHTLVNLNEEMKVAETVKHVQFLVSHGRKKFSLLHYMLKRKKGTSSLKQKKVLVFCRTRRRCDVLAERLQELGYAAFSVHKGKSSSVRTKAVEMFRIPLTEEYMKTEGKATQTLLSGIKKSIRATNKRQESDTDAEKQEVLLDDYKIQQRQQQQQKRKQQKGRQSSGHDDIDEDEEDDWDVDIEDDDTEVVDTEEERIKALELLKQPIQILISTDVMSRGIDVEDLPFVINYDPPPLPEDYVHRVGRTGRAGNQGMAISFVSMTPQITKIGGREAEINEMHFVRFVEKFLNERVEWRKVPGPWRDNDNVSQRVQHLSEMDTNVQLDPDEKQALLRSRQVGLELLNKKRIKEKRRLQHLKRHNKLRGDFVERYSESYRALQQQISTHGDAPETLLQHAPSMRNFKEGRYEDVLRQFEERRAVNRGVLKPTVPGSGRKTKHVKGKKKTVNMNSAVNRIIF